MIYIVGDNPTTAEYRGAEYLRDLMLIAWPSMKTNQNNDVWFLTLQNCFGEATKESDLIVIAQLTDDKLTYYPVLPIQDSAGNFFLPTNPVRVESFCLVIEIKEHPPENIIRDGNNFRVSYKNGEIINPHTQNNRQMNAMINYLGPRIGRVPLITPIVWLRRMSYTKIPQRPHATITDDSLNWNALMNIVGQERKHYTDGFNSKNWKMWAAPSAVVLNTVQTFTFQGIPEGRKIIYIEDNRVKTKPSEQSNENNMLPVNPESNQTATQPQPTTIPQAESIKQVKPLLSDRKDWIKPVSHLLSYALHPAIILPITIILVSSQAQHSITSGLLDAFIIFSGLIPGLTYIIVKTRKNEFSHFQLIFKEERKFVLPLLLIGVAASIPIYIELGRPAVIWQTVLIMLLAGIGATLITRLWKISFHAAVGMGAATLFITSSVLITIILAIVAIIAGLSRIMVKHHTLAQVIVGWIYGALITFILMYIINFIWRMCSC